jgi:hypothetical protein
MAEHQRIGIPSYLVRFVRRYILWIVAVVVLILLGAAFELGRYNVYQANPGLEGQEQATAVLDKVGQLIQLPQSETPTMATISNAASARQGQPFLANAQNGDVLIVYTNAGEALLYRPSNNKLIAVGPVDTSGPQTSAAETPVPASVATTTDATDTPSTK